MLMIIAFLLIGPVPFINLEPSVPQIYGSTALIGAGYAIVMVSTFGRSQGAAKSLGYKDDITTYLMMSGEANY